MKKSRKRFNRLEWYAKKYGFVKGMTGKKEFAYTMKPVPSGWPRFPMVTRALIWNFFYEAEPGKWKRGEKKWKQIVLFFDPKSLVNTFACNGGPFIDLNDKEALRVYWEKEEREFWSDDEEQLSKQEPSDSEDSSMSYNETGFRPIYHRFTAFMLTDTLKSRINDFPDEEDANCVLTYGYVDDDDELMLEILAAGKKTESGFYFFEGNDAVHSSVQIASVENDNYFCFDDADGSLHEKYAEKINSLKDYDASEEVEKTREMSFLDDSRDKYYIDYVRVYLMKEGFEQELCWTKIVGLGDHWFIGRLLEEPKQNFGYSAREKIAFYVHEQEDNSVICYSNMDPSLKLTADDLQDGKLLKQAAAAFGKERTNEHLESLLELLRDSYVWVPADVKFSDRDQANLRRHGAGDILTSQDEIRFVPNLLINGDDKYFLPVFSAIEEMGEDYGRQFSRIRYHFPDVIPLARDHPKDVSGIVLNPFTDSFVLKKDLFEFVETMKSRLVDKEEA